MLHFPDRGRRVNGSQVIGRWSGPVSMHGEARTAGAVIRLGGAVVVRDADVSRRTDDGAVSAHVAARRLGVVDAHAIAADVVYRVACAYTN